jgi:mannonate dehydratase
MRETWRWFGPPDPITLAEVRQTGAKGIVSALHHVPSGIAWTPTRSRPARPRSRRRG